MNNDLTYYEGLITNELARAKELVARRNDGEYILDFDIRGKLYELALRLAPEARYQDREYMHKLIDPKIGEVSVDIAAGEGFLTQSITQWTNAPVYAIDPSQEQLKMLAEQPNSLIKPIKGSLDSSEVLGQLPLGEIDFVTSFGGLHHVRDQRKMMEHIAQVLKVGGRFTAGDVGRNTRLSYHFDTFVTEKCITGHTAQWLDNDRLKELCIGLPLKVSLTEATPIQWVFNSTREMALFFKGLHAYDLPDDEVVADLDEALGFEERDGKVSLNWPMFLFRIDKIA